MSIVPQIALVKPNREVRQFVEPTPDALRDAIAESNDSGQLTLQKGTYGAQNPGQTVEVPLGIDIIVLPGADISQINLVDPDGNPFPNVFDFNNLGNIDAVVNTLSGGDGITVDQNTGDVTARVPNDGITSDLLASDSVGTDELSSNNNPNADDLLSYNGSTLTWVNPTVETADPISGSGTSNDKITLDTKDGVIEFGISNGQLTGTIGSDQVVQSMINSGAVGNSELDAGSGNDGQFLELTGSGITWSNITAEDVGGTTFQETYTFSNELTLSSGASITGTTSIVDSSSNTVGEISPATNGLSVKGLGSIGDDNLTLEVDSGNIKMSAPGNVLVEPSSDVRINPDGDVIVQQEASLSVRTNDSNMENLSTSEIVVHEEGYMDFPIWDNNSGKEPPDPPSGYIRIWAFTGAAGNNDGRWAWKASSGNFTTLNVGDPIDQDP